MRQNGSSGGVGTAIVHFLLKYDKVDAVIGVGFHPVSKSKPVYMAVKSEEEAGFLSGSKYLFMEFQPIEKLLMKYCDSRTAVFAQPCFVHKLRFLQHTRYRNLKYIISPFCGYNMSYEGTLFLLRKAGIHPVEVKRLSYRYGPYPGGFYVETEKGKTIQFPKAAYEIVNLMFLRSGCRKCPYYSGEGADIALGDAWIRYHDSYTVILSRTPEGRSIIRGMEKENLLRISVITSRQLVRMHRGNIRFKKFSMPWYLRLIHNIVRKRWLHPWLPFGLLVCLSGIRRKICMGIEDVEQDHE